MDGENNGKPYEQMDDLGGYIPLFLVQHPYLMPVFLGRRLSETCITEMFF